MKRLASLSAGTALLAALVMIFALLATFWLGRQAETVQRVVPFGEATAALLGEVGTPVGGANMYLVFDKKAFIESTDARGEPVRFLNETYLLENDIYPWQMKTVRFARNVVAVVSGLALVLFGSLSLLLKARLDKKAETH